MQIYVSELVGTPEEAESILHFTATGFILYVPKSGQEAQSFAFDPASIDTWPDIMNIVQDQLGFLKILWASEVADNRDGLTSQLSRKRVLDMMKRHSASIALCPDRTWTVYANQKTFVSAEAGVQMPAILTVGWRRAVEVFGEKTPTLRPFMARSVAKQKALGQISQPDAIVALEIQVDMLMVVLEALANGVPPPTWFGHMVSSIAPVRGNLIYPATPEESIALIAAQKAKVRAIQTTYFTELMAIYG